MPELPGSLAALLSLLRPGFTAPSFSTFCWLVSGFTARIGDRTVTGMWQAVGLAGELHHSRAHDFFARARWRPDRRGLLLGDFVTATLLPAGTPLRLVIDDTLFGRSGGKVFGAQLHYDNAAPAGAGRRVRLGNCWVVVGLLVELPFMAGRPLCLPILFRLYRSGPARPSRVALAVELLELMAARYRTRQIELVADGAYAARGLARELPARATLTTRMRKDAALYELAPSRTGKPG
jgi:hypothetical protein